MKLIAILALCLSAFAVQAVEVEGGVDIKLGAEVAAPEAEVTLSTFYENLTPYGVWIEDAELGWVWQPRECKADVEWRPYCQSGHWVWTEHGWYWASDYKWGWAAFHYGRWSRHGVHGWVWSPDCTWGPAWVNWRECDTHMGWAPLPPRCTFEAGVGFSFRGKHVDFGCDFGLVDVDFTFVPCHSFLEINLFRHRCGHREVVKVYHTTVIRNTYVINNKIIVNQGCSKVFVEKHCGRKIAEVHVRDSHVRGSDRQTKDGISAYRPHVQNKAPVDPQTVAKKRAERRQENIKKMNTPTQPHREAPKHQAPKPAPRQQAQPHHQAAPAPRQAPQHHPPQNHPNQKKHHNN